MDTHAKRSVKHCLDMLAPFEASGALEETGQRQFYQFMISIYQGMYEKPEEYLVFPAPYEEYLACSRQRKMQRKKEKEHITDSRESTLRNTFQQAIQFYATYLYHMGLNCSGLDQHTGALVISKEKYADVLARMNRIHDSKYNAQRYQVLSKLGMQTCEKDDAVHMIHEKHRQAMAGLLYLCNAPDSKYRWMNFLRLDYKNAYAPIPTVEDICRTLSARSRAAVKKLEECLAGMRVKAKIRPLRGIVSDFKWKVEYSCKGKSICGFYGDSESFMLCIYFNHFENINEFARLLQEEDQDLFLWFKDQFPERLCKCPNNRRVYFAGEPRRICGLSNRAEVVNPSDEDMEKALYILRKYREID